MTDTKSFEISHDHPCLAGHFPNNPIVPGVVILDEISSVIIQVHSIYRIHSFLSVKFLQPLKSGQSVNIKLEDKAKLDNNYSKLKFRCTFNGAIIAQGEIKLEERSPEKRSEEEIH